jgi:hypothetical protein
LFAEKRGKGKLIESSAKAWGAIHQLLSIILKFRILVLLPVSTIVRYGGDRGGTSKLGGDERVGGHPFLGERVGGGGTTFSARGKDN